MNEEWQPIETAPKDGTRILVYGKYIWYDYEENSEVGIICAEWAWEDCYKTEGNWLSITVNHYVDYVYPTHWMPLPSEPKF